MAIDYNETERPAMKVIDGDEDFTLTAGKSLKIESSPGGDEHFDMTVPAGKTWNVRVFVRIEETSV